MRIVSVEMVHAESDSFAAFLHLSSFVTSFSHAV